MSIDSRGLGRQPGKRRPGRPRKSERPITPESLHRIATLYLHGRSTREIANAVGVAHGTVDHHLAHTIKPLWRNAIQWDASIEIARADEVIRLAFEGYDRSLEPATCEREKFASADALARKLKKQAPRGARREKLVERTLEKAHRDGDKGWLELVAAMMDFKAKVKGGYAPSRFHISQQTELRVAGLSPSELDQKMLERMAELLAERQRHRQIIQDATKAAGHGEN